LRCLQDLPQLKGKNTADRKKFLQKNDRFLKHDSMACLLTDNDIVTLGTVIRDEDLLAENPPVVCFQIPDAAIERALLHIKQAKNIKLLQLGTALFAYEPILKRL
jgi:hypothetical protein